jgi:osmotically inducible protein OsmC
MKLNKAHAVWRGNLKDGSGQMQLDKSSIEFPYSFKSRFEDGKGSNPETLIAAAHAGCFSMAFANELAGAGYEVKKIATTAEIKLDVGDGGAKISESHLIVEAEVKGIGEEAFQKIAKGAKENCPVSKALSAITITMDAKLVS